MQKFFFQVHPYLYTLKLPHYILRGYIPFYNFILPFNFDNFVSYNFYNFNLKDLIGRDYLFFKSAYLLFWLCWVLVEVHRIFVAVCILLSSWGLWA